MKTYTKSNQSQESFRLEKTINVTHRTLAIFKEFYLTSSYTEAAKNFNITGNRASQVVHKLIRQLRFLSPEMSETFHSPYKKHLLLFHADLIFNTIQTSIKNGSMKVKE